MDEKRSENLIKDNSQEKTGVQSFVFCPRCGNTITGDLLNAFCLKCGYRFCLSCSE